MGIRLGWKIGKRSFRRQQRKIHMMNEMKKMNMIHMDDTVIIKKYPPMRIFLLNTYCNCQLYMV
jgi:hypothetical protein